MSIIYNGTNIDSIKYNGTDLTKVTYNGTVVWEKQQLTTPLTLTATWDNTKIFLKQIGTGLPTIQYSTNGITWSDYTYGTGISLNAGQFVQFWNNSTTTFGSANGYGNFEFAGWDIAASGNCNSLINFSSDLSAYCFMGLFMGCTTLIRAPLLPSTSLDIHCYEHMFTNCRITVAPVLPATTLCDDCYYSMFSLCNSLITAPILPATIMAERCYKSMFFGCTSLTMPPVLPATTLADNCYDGMFWSCTGLIIAPELPATTLADGCYKGMFGNCPGLTTPPVLPATVLEMRCYWQMFIYCTSLIYVPKLVATVIPQTAYADMFNGCTSLQVSDTQTADAPYAWNIPEIGTFTETSYGIVQDIFIDCAGTRSSDSFLTTEGTSKTYYTQNPPI